MIRSAALALTLLAIGQPAFAQDASDTAGEAAVSAAHTVEAAKADPGHWRAVDPENLFIFETTKGRILIEAFPEIAPGHYKQFAAIIRSGDYDGTSFHRVIEGFMAQGGDIFALHGRDSGLPNMQAEFTFARNPDEMPMEFPIGPADESSNGYIKGFPIATLPLWLRVGEDPLNSWMPHCEGVVSTARLGDDENSGNSQFFLMRGYAKHLDKNYTAWGRVIDGVDVVKSIKLGNQARDGVVLTDPDILNSAKVAADLPEGERPNAWVMRTDTPEFAASVDQSSWPHVCDLPPVPAVVEN